MFYNIVDLTSEHLQEIDMFLGYCFLVAGMVAGRVLWRANEPPLLAVAVCASAMFWGPVVGIGLVIRSFLGY